jgi:hypothetical protein
MYLARFAHAVQIVVLNRVASAVGEGSIAVRLAHDYPA